MLYMDRYSNMLKYELKNIYTKEKDEHNDDG